MDLSRAKYILPNLFTLTSVGAGVFSIHLSTTAMSVSDMTMAAYLLVGAMACDMLDGRVARLTRTESELGLQLDSLADAISFGVAPGFLLYHWGMSHLGLWGVFAAALYVMGAVLRLARFNVMAGREEGPSRYFLGLPTPLAAGTVISLVLAYVSFTETMTTGAGWSVAAIAIFLGALMVSNVRYRSFKDMSLRKPDLLAVLAVLGVILAAMVVKPGIAFGLLLVVYVIVGLLGGVVSLGKHLFFSHESYVADEEEVLIEEASDGEP